MPPGPASSGFFLFLYLSCAFLPFIHGDDSFKVSREVFILEGSPPDVIWVVQISDLHLSSYHPERAGDLKRLLAPALKIIRPSLLLITGDLTDAKNKDRTTTRQDLSEWLQYKQAMEVLASESGMNMKALIDIRGNHDKYGVPFVGHKLDFFSNYSISSRFSRLSTVQSIALVGTNWNYVFLGLDDSLEAGLRCPSNLFGHTNNQRLEAVKAELEYWSSHLDGPVTNVVFGHFPMSFVTSSETGERYESLFARHSVSTYICGHLHAKFSKQLWRHHLIDSTDGSRQSSKAEFWEWELGDWKESKLFRILAIDGGHVSFTDISLLHPQYDKGQEGFGAVIVITHPLDSRNMNRMISENSVTRADVSALVFSMRSIIHVIAKIFDSFNASELVEEVILHPSNDSPCLYRAQLNMSKYLHMPPTRFWLQVSAVDIHGNETASGLRPFSMDGELAPLRATWLEYLVLYVRWERLYKVLLWANFFLLLMILFLPMPLNIFMAKNMLYQKWATSVSISLPIARRATFLVLWFLIEGSQDRKVWSAMAIYLLWLLMFPWFWGHAESEDGIISSMSMHGWTVKFPGVQVANNNLGNPDVMAITLPFMYLIVTPLFLLIYCMFTERSLSHLHSGGKKICSIEKFIELKAVSQLQEYDDGNDKISKANHSIKRTPCKICRGWTRTGILLATMALLYIHFRQCSYIARAYGVISAILSPGLLWWPTLLLAWAIYSSGSVSKPNKS